MNKQIKRYLIVILFFFSLLFLGVVYEESSTASRAFAFKGLFIAPITDWPVTQIFISHVFAFLYSLIQDVPWYGIIDYGVVVISLFLFYDIIQKKGFLFLIPFLILVVDDFVLFSFTRTAMLACAAGLFGLFTVLKKVEQKRNTQFYIQVSLYSLLCLYGFFNRPQAFAYVSAIFTLFLISYFLIHRNEFKYFKKSIKFLSIPFVLVFIFGFIHQLNLSPSIREAQRLTPAFYNIHSSNYHDSFEEISRKDSLALVLVKESYVNDLEVINEAFVKRITQSQPQAYLSIDKFTQLTQFKQNVSSYLPFYVQNHLFDFIIICFLVFYILFDKNLNRKKRVLIFSYGLLVFGSLIAITNVVKMEMRISSPLFVILFFSLILITHSDSKKNTQNWIGYLSVLVSIYFSFGIVNMLNEHSKRQSLKVEKNLGFKKKLDNRYNNYTLVLSNSSLNIIHRKPFQEFKNEKTFTIKFFEGEAMAYQPIPRQSFIDYCGSIKVEDIFDQMFKEKNQTVYLATPESKELMRAYLEANYNKDYSFKVVDTLAYHNDYFKDILIYQPVEIISTDSTSQK